MEETTKGWMKGGGEGRKGGMEGGINVPVLFLRLI